MFILKRSHAIRFENMCAARRSTKIVVCVRTRRRGRVTFKRTLECILCRIGRSNTLDVRKAVLLHLIGQKKKINNNIFNNNNDIKKRAAAAAVLVYD